MYKPRKSSGGYGASGSATYTGASGGSYSGSGGYPATAVGYGGGGGYGAGGYGSYGSGGYGTDSQPPQYPPAAAQSGPSQRYNAQGSGGLLSSWGSGTSGDGRKGSGPSLLPR